MVLLKKLTKKVKQTDFPIEAKITKTENTSISKLKNFFKQNKIIKAKVTMISNATETITLDLGHKITCYMEFSDFSIYVDETGGPVMKQLYSYLDQYIYVRIKSMEDKIFVERKSILSSTFETINSLLEESNNEYIFKGYIIAETKNGFFLDLGYGILAYLNRTNYSYDTTMHITEIVGDTLCVKITEKNQKTSNFSYFLKHKDIHSTYQSRLENYNPEDSMIAKIITVEKQKDTYILYFESYDVIGISQIRGTNYEVGDRVPVVVKSIKEKGLSVRILSR